MTRGRVRRRLAAIQARLARAGRDRGASAVELAILAPALIFASAGCGYLGSTEMVRNPGAVAHTGANGTADCGVTFRQPGQWNITATLTWRACRAVGGQDGPPPAACNPVPGAALNAVNWARNVNIHEIPAANGGG